MRANPVLASIAERAAHLDTSSATTRENLEALGGLGLLGLGAPANARGELSEMARTIGDIAAECMSTAFSVWANRMAVEYLLAAGTPHAYSAVQPLLAGTALGVTGMASAFKAAAGCGAIELVATQVDDGYEICGSLPWASNLHPDSMLVTAAVTTDGDPLIIVLPLSSPGVSTGNNFNLLAMGSTASSSVTFSRVAVRQDQVLSRDFASFLEQVRPTFLVLQSAMCLGLASRCITESQRNLAGVNAVFEDEVAALEGRRTDAAARLASFSARVGTVDSPSKRDLITLRLEAAKLASDAASIEATTAGGRGYGTNTATSRRFREAAFLPVQSPSHGQLRWELERCT